jgi:uncharacterized membrane protein
MGMTPPSYIAYVIIGGVVLLSLLAPLFVGGDAWVTPIAVIPFAIVYALYDRTLARKEEAGEAH